MCRRLVSGGDARDRAENRAVTDLPEDHATWDTEAEVICPYCGEKVTVGLDPGGGLTRPMSRIARCAVSRGRCT